MEPYLAKTAGFCFGVQRAIDTANAQLETGAKVCTFGPIIHNAEVIKELEEKGISVLDTGEGQKDLSGCRVIIRSHGVSGKIYERLEKSGAEIIDATCPFVKKIHKTVMEEEEKGRFVVVAGDPCHPEVEGICGWGNGRVAAVRDLADFEGLGLKSGEKISLVAQTTFNLEKFRQLVVEIQNKKEYDINVINTICNATQERQLEARQIASRVDMMIVIGDRQSSNSRKLFEICQKECTNTYFIQTLGDFHPESVNSVRSIGITAGASTPKKIIEEVSTYVRTKL